MAELLHITEVDSPVSLASAVLNTRGQLLDAIERELAGLGPSYSEHVLRLCEAFAKLRNDS